MGNREYEEASGEGRDYNEHEGGDCHEHHQERTVRVVHDKKCLNAGSIEELCSECLTIWNKWRDSLII